MRMVYIKMGVKELFDKLDVTKRGYKVNKWIIRFAFIIMLIYIGVVLKLDGAGVLLGTDFYIECPTDSLTPCANPFYDPMCYEPICEDEVWVQGFSFGTKPSLWAQYGSFVLVSILLLALAVNHNLYNRGYFKNERKRKT
jgi:hypothetical protein